MKRIEAGPPLAPIGFCAPPVSASPMGPPWLAIGIAVAMLFSTFGIAASHVAALRAEIASLKSIHKTDGDGRLFPKDAARCCDPNGNQIWRAQ